MRPNSSAQAYQGPNTIANRIIMLATLAEYTNFVTIILVLLAFSIVAVSICRFPVEHILYPRAMSVQYVKSEGPIQAPMILVENPFSVVLEQHDGLSHGVKCKISSKSAAVVQALWGVSIADLHRNLHSDWIPLKEVFLRGKLLEDSCVCTGNLQQLEICSEQSVVFSRREDVSFNMGSVPRDRYPLVIILFSKEPEEQTDSCPDYYKTVGLLAILVHVKDEVCPMPSCVLAKYIKMVSGQVQCLQELFVAGKNDATSGGSGYEDVSDAEDGDCVVCRVSRVMFAILPCRHACLCRQCLRKLKNCPLCRGPISSYFAVNRQEEADEHVLHPDVAAVNVIAPGDDVRWRRLAGWNERLNQMLGIN